jgi:hypothetical protein
MIQIEPTKYKGGWATLLQVKPNIADGAGLISYNLFDAYSNILAFGSLPVDETFALAYDGSEIMAGNYIAQYLSLTIK